MSHKPISDEQMMEIWKLLTPRGLLKILIFSGLLLAMSGKPELGFASMDTSLNKVRMSSASVSVMIASAPTSTPGPTARLVPVRRLGLGSIGEPSWSPDGKTLAVDSSIGVWLYDAFSPNTTPRLLESRTSSRTTFTPDSKILAFVDNHTTVKLWDVNSGKLIRTITGFESSVNAIAFSPDGLTLVAGTDSATSQIVGDDYIHTKNTLLLWNVSSGNLLRKFQSPKQDFDVVMLVAFSPDGKIVASGTLNNTVRLWDVKTGKLLHTLNPQSMELSNILISPDSKTVTTLNWDNMVRVWDVASGRLLYTLGDGEFKRQALNAAYSPDGKTLASGSVYGVRLSDAKTGKLRHILKDHIGYGYISYSPNGKTLAATGRDLTVRLWDASSDRLLFTLTGHSNSITSAVFSPDSKILASTSLDHTIRLWDVSSGNLKATLGGYAWDVNSIAFSPDGKTLAAGYRSPTSGDGVRLWDTDSGKLLLSLNGQGKTVFDIAFSPNGKIVAAGGMSGKVNLWDTTSGTLLLTIDEPPEFTDQAPYVHSVAFSPDGKTVAYGGNSGELAMADVSNGTHIKTFSGFLNAVRSVTFSPNGKTLAAGSSNRVRLWDIDTGEIRQTLTVNDDVTSIAFTVDGTLLAVGSENNKVQLCDASNGGLLHTFNAGYSNLGVRTVTFSPNDKILATGTVMGISNCGM